MEDRVITQIFYYFEKILSHFLPDKSWVSQFPQVNGELFANIYHFEKGMVNPLNTCGIVLVTAAAAEQVC